MAILMEDRIAGCLIGAAYGDALGAPTENRTREQIKEKWGYVDHLIVPPNDVFARGNKAGQVTDDFSMAYVTILEILKNNGCVEKKVAEQALIEWSKNERFFEQFVGPTSRRFINRLKGLTEETSEKKFEPVNHNRDASNGAAMKIGPISTFAKGNFETAKLLTWEICSLTHGNKASMSAAMAVSFAVNAALNEEPLSEILKWASNGATQGEMLGYKIAAPSVKKRMQFAITIGSHTASLDEAMDVLRKYFDCSGLAADSVPVSFGLIANSVYNHRSVKEVIAAAANIGNDTDTMATIVGAILGAYCGKNAFEETLIQEINTANQYDLEQLANRIAKQTVYVKTE